MPDTIEVHGLKDVERRIYSFGRKLGDKVVIDSLKNGARVVLRETKRRAPKKTGRLRKGIVLRKSKIYTRRKTGNKIGVFITLRKGKGKDDPKDAYYGRFIEDGWNTHGERTTERLTVTSTFGKRTGRKTAKGKTDVPGVKMIKTAYLARKQEATRLIIASAKKGADVVARRVGLK